MKAWLVGIVLPAIGVLALSALGAPGQLQFKGEPVDLGPSAPRVGELIPDLGFTDLTGTAATPEELMGAAGLVVVIRDVHCPVTSRYGARLARLEEEYAAEGFGFLFKFQLHYTANGRQAIDQSRIGFVFANEPAPTDVRTSAAFDTEFVIPAGAGAHEVAAEYEFPEDAELLSLFPHTHLRGREFYFQLAYPDGRLEEVLPISRYDFNRQLNYAFHAPKRVPAGTRMHIRAIDDNSAANPANPDPAVDVAFGEQTWEELLIDYVNWIPAPAR